MVDSPPLLDPHSKAKIVTFTLRDPYRYSVERKTAVDDKLKVKLFSHRHMGDTLKQLFHSREAQSNLILQTPHY